MLLLDANSDLRLKQALAKEMATGQFIAYYRVSTKRQGASGLGLEAQKKSVDDWLNGGRWDLVAEYTEVESGTKSDKQRPQLLAALEHCRKAKAGYGGQVREFGRGKWRNGNFGHV